MPNNVRVYGKAQNRTALGIVHAYMVMYPHATLADLRKAFPNELCPDKGVDEMFLPLEEAAKFNSSMTLYFAKPDEVLKMGDGQQVAMACMWSKASFDRIVGHAAQYAIEIASFEKTAGREKGGFRLEYLNGYIPPVPQAKKKGIPAWVWIVLALLVLGILVLLLWPRGKVVEKEVVVRDTVYVQQIEEIERHFNAAQFAQGDATLNDDAKLALHDLAKVMRSHEELRLRIEGHTSAEGDAQYNQELSERRAQAAVDFLVNKEGIAAERLEAVGKGASEPIDPNDFAANRRTEFEIVEK